MEHDPQQPDSQADQTLKDALRASLPRETASDALRARIKAALAAEQIAGEQSVTRRIDAASTPVSTSPSPMRLSDVSSPRWHQRPVFRQVCGLAAAVVLAAGVFWYVRDRDVRPAVANNAPIPATLARSLVQRHDLCGSDHEHQMFGVAINDLPLLRKKLQQQLKNPVVIDVIDAGWIYDGGRFCPVGKLMAAHLMFHRGEEELSVLTFATPENTAVGTYESQADSTHAIAGWVDADRMVCVVVSGSLGKDMTEVHHLRDAVQKQAIATQTAALGNVFHGELIAAR